MYYIATTEDARHFISEEDIDFSCGPFDTYDEAKEALHHTSVFFLSNREYYLHSGCEAAIFFSKDGENFRELPC